MKAVRSLTGGRGRENLDGMPPRKPRRRAPRAPKFSRASAAVVRTVTFNTSLGPRVARFARKETAPNGMVMFHPIPADRELPFGGRFWLDPDDIISYGSDPTAASQSRVPRKRNAPGRISYEILPVAWHGKRRVGKVVYKVAWIRDGEYFFPTHIDDSTDREKLRSEADAALAKMLARKTNAAPPDHGKVAARVTKLAQGQALRKFLRGSPLTFQDALDFWGARAARTAPDRAEATERDLSLALERMNENDPAYAGRGYPAISTVYGLLNLSRLMRGRFAAELGGAGGSTPKPRRKSNDQTPLDARTYEAVWNAGYEAASHATAQRWPLWDTDGLFIDAIGTDRRLPKVLYEGMPQFWEYFLAFERGVKAFKGDDGSAGPDRRKANAKRSVARTSRATSTPAGQTDGVDAKFKLFSGAGPGKFSVAGREYLGDYWSYVDVFDRDGRPVGGGEAVFDEGAHVLWLAAYDDATPPRSDDVKYVVTGRVYRGASWRDRGGGQVVVGVRRKHDGDD